MISVAIDQPKVFDSPRPECKPSRPEDRQVHMHNGQAGNDSPSCYPLSPTDRESVPRYPDLFAGRHESLLQSYITP